MIHGHSRIGAKAGPGRLGGGFFSVFGIFLSQPQPPVEVAEREGLRQASCPRESRYLAEASAPGFAIGLRLGPRSLQVCQLFSQVKHRCKELEPKTESMQRIPMPTARARSQHAIASVG